MVVKRSDELIVEGSQSADAKKLLFCDRFVSLKLVLKRSDELFVVDSNAAKAKSPTTGNRGEAAEKVDVAGGKVDILVTEIFDSELLGEGLLPTMRHAVKHLLKEGGSVIPAHAKVFCQLVECRSLWAMLAANSAPPGNQSSESPLQDPLKGPMLAKAAVERAQVIIQELDTCQGGTQPGQANLFSMREMHVDGLYDGGLLRPDWRDHWSQCVSRVSHAPVHVLPGGLGGRLGSQEGGSQLALKVKVTDGNIAGCEVVVLGHGPALPIHVASLARLLEPSVISAITVVQDMEASRRFIEQGCELLASPIPHTPSKDLAASTSPPPDKPDSNSNSKSLKLTFMRPSPFFKRLAILGQTGQAGRGAEGAEQGEPLIIVGEPYFNDLEGLPPWTHAAKFWNNCNLIRQAYPNRRVISTPSRATLRGVMVSLPELWRSRQCVGVEEGVDLAPANPHLGVVGLPQLNTPGVLLYSAWQCGGGYVERSERFSLLEFDLSGPMVDLESCAKVLCEPSKDADSQPGPTSVHAMVMWVDYHMPGSEGPATLSNAPDLSGGPNSNVQAVFLMKDPVVLDFSGDAVGGVELRIKAVFDPSDGDVEIQVI
eukprot:gene7497-642_t